MACRIISVITQKGGAGKTNCAVSLAGAFARRHLRTLLIDGDSQGTATRWVTNAEEGASPICVVNLSHAGAKIHQEVRKLIANYDVILVDCPPSQESPVAKSMLLVSDLAIIPMIPNPGDLWATTQIIRMIDDMSSINESLKAVLFGSIMRPNVQSMEYVLGDIRRLHPGVVILNSKLSLRTAYPEAMVTGDSVHALGKRAQSAILEVEALASEVLAVLNLDTATEKRVA